MTSDDGGGPASVRQEVRQEVRAEGGHAYGAVGADIHVFGNGTPVYLLFAYRRVSGLDSDWLRAQPSRMLDARAEVVDFTGRDAELGELIGWREQGARCAVRWLHGPGGQGKSRLAVRLAADSEAAGWKVVTAVHGTDTGPPAEGSQDLRLDGHTGVLVIVDYADRWPASHLSWLFQNRLLRRSVPARVLLIGRSAHGWPPLRAQLNRLRENIDTSDQELRPLPADGDERARMFTTARSCFAAHYPQVTEVEAIAPPGPLGHPDFGLTLAVQMAALVAVDARAHGRRPPEDMVALTAYLLDREHENWRQLYENAAAGLPHRTPDHVMARAVFTAVLTGPTPRPVGRRVLGGLVPDVPADEILADHAVCYPPTDPARSHVLEPLLPDRLAEDFLALSLPGSPVTGFASDPWAALGVNALLARGGDGAAAPWTPRAVTFLAEAADRARLSELLSSKGRLEEAIPPAQEAVVIGRRLAQDDPGHLPDLAVALNNLGLRFADVFRPADALAPSGEALEICRRLAQENPTDYEPMLATSLYNLGLRHSETDRPAEAVEILGEAVGRYRQLVAVEGPNAYAAQLAMSLSALGKQLGVLRRHEGMLAASQEGLDLLGPLAEADPDTHLPEFTRSLLSYAVMRLSARVDLGQALGAATQAVGTYWDVAERYSGYIPHLRFALSVLADLLDAVGEHAEAAEIRRKRETIPDPGV